MRLAVAVLAALVLVAADAVASTGAWSETAPMNLARRQHVAALLPDGRVLVAGGLTAAGARTATAEAYDPRSGTWQALPSMERAMAGHAAVVLGGAPCQAQPAAAWCGRVLVVGDGAQLFDPATDTWIAAGTPAAARTDHSATLLADGRVLVAGGAPPAGDDRSSLASAELFDPRTSSWSAADSLEQGRQLHAAARLPDGSILLAGGVEVVDSSEEDVPTTVDTLRSAERFDPATGAWSPAAPLPVERALAGAAISDGRLALVGGTTGLAARRAADAFDPSGESGAWSALPPLDVARVAPAVFGLPDGRLLAAGGDGGGGEAINSAETLAPGAASWSFTGLLQFRRAGHAGTLLPDGRVLVSGGRATATGALATAELFDPSALPVPARVGDLAARAESATDVTLSFSAPGSDGRAGPPARRFLVRQAAEPIGDLAAFDRASRLCGGVCALEPGGSGELLSIRVRGLAPSATYHYAVRAENSDGRLGPLSNAASATTHAAPVLPVSDLAATATGHRTIRLTFTAPGTDALAPTAPQAYVVKQASVAIDDASFGSARSLCGGVCSLPVSAPGSRVTLTVTDLRPATRYFFALRPVTGAGATGPRSNGASATTSADRLAPGRVRRLKARALSATRVRLQFSSVASDGAKGPPVAAYVVKQSRRSLGSARRFRRARALCGGTCRLSGSVGSRLTLDVTRLCPRTTYRFAVRAVDEAGNRGPRTRQVRVRTRAARRVCAR